MKRINKITLVLAKIFEIVHWVGMGVSAILLLLSIFDIDEFRAFMADGLAESGKTLSTYCFDVNVIGIGGEINAIALILFWAGSIITFGLMAMVFRNIYLIMKTLNGNNKHANSTSPFQKDIIRMIKEIGIFSISSPIVAFFLSAIICAVSMINGMDGVEVSVSIEGFIVGLISLCLTNVFAYGAKLEKDVDGLL